MLYEMFSFVFGILNLFVSDRFTANTIISTCNLRNYSQLMQTVFNYILLFCKSPTDCIENKQALCPQLFLPIQKGTKVISLAGNDVMLNLTAERV
jgi:hypothetical protein